jgi:hypothetical protein
MNYDLSYQQLNVGLKDAQAQAMPDEERRSRVEEYLEQAIGRMAAMQAMPETQDINSDDDDEELHQEPPPSKISLADVERFIPNNIAFQTLLTVMEQFVQGGRPRQEDEALLASNTIEIQESATIEVEKQPSSSIIDGLPGLFELSEETLCFPPTGSKIYRLLGRLLTSVKAPDPGLTRVSYKCVSTDDQRTSQKLTVHSFVTSQCF